MATARIDEVLSQFSVKEIEAALKRMKKLGRHAARIQKINDEIKRLNEEKEKIESGSYVPARSRSRRAVRTRRRSTTGPATKIKRKPNARRLNDISLADAIEQVLRGKRSMHYKELTEAIQKEDLYRTKSKNLLSTVAVTLKRNPRFKKISPGIYALK